MPHTLPPTEPPRRRFGLSSPLGRLVLLFMLFVLLQLPLGMIRDVVEERSARRDEAVASVAAAWGGEQRVIGPLLRVTCIDDWERVDADGKRSHGELRRAAWFLPERLDIDAALSTETRRRGIFEVPVYAAALRLQGSFARPAAADCPLEADRLDWSTAELVLGLAEPRSVQAESGLQWNGTQLQFRPATGSATEVLASGIHVPLGGVVDPFPEARASFAIVLGFNGSSGLRLTPVAKETLARVRADWPHPSFQGGWLPAQHQAESGRFDAQWSISYLGRDFPQAWDSPADHAEALQRTRFGVDLLQPVDHYVMAERIMKYAVLTVLFTLLTIWLVETLGGRSIHPIQYGFIGAALCLFGLLQLALAEHVGFTIAYVAAATCVVVQVGLYCRSVLRQPRHALMVGAVLAGIHAGLYAILDSEDFALLGGALALFAGLTIAMYTTRRVDWSARAAAVG